MNTVVSIQFTPDELRELVRSEVASGIELATSGLMTQAEMCRFLLVDTRTFKTMNLPAYVVGKSVKYRLSDVPKLKTLNQ